MTSTSRQGTAWVGTSGWRYRHWRGKFYPPGLVQARELAFAATHFRSLEINGTFYSLTRPQTCARWRAEVPKDFLFAVKGSRYITHMLKLKAFAAPLANFYASGVLALGKALGPFLWQLPPQLPFERQRAEEFFSALPRTMTAAETCARGHDARLDGRALTEAPDGRRARLRHAIEVRHNSWLNDNALQLMEQFDIALVAADTAGKYTLSFAETGKFAYYRLHGSVALYQSRYEDRELEDWATRIEAECRRGRDVYVYFDNDAHAHAPLDALRLQSLLTRSLGASRNVVGATAV